jgi:DNA polymerase-3 subunit gamma/tau
MSYLVFARKWRPQVFEEVVGQRHITQTLQNAISQKRVAHAFLFSGARGVGKTSTARILAKALNCEAGPEINPCNQCTSCREISSGNSMDVVEIDGASNRGIDEIRELRENVRYTPAKSRHKIYIIDEVHMLTREAFNALLKTLEEPPSHIIFVFATTEPHKIPATILSRCQRYDFKRIPLKEIIENLNRIVQEEKIKISQRALLSIAQESEGSLRDAQSLLDQVISYGGKDIRDEELNEVLGLIDRKLLQDTVEALAQGDAERCLQTIDHIYHYGYDLQHFCRELLQYFRNLILIKVSPRPEGFMELPEEEMEVLKRQAGQLQFDQWSHLFSLLLKGEEEMTQSAFPRVMLEMTLIRMARLKSFLPIDEVIQRLEVLGRRGKEEAPPVLEEKRPKVLQEKEKPRIRQEEDRNPPSAREEKERPPLQKDEERSVSDKEREETWKGLVDLTRARNPILGAFLILGNLTHLSQERLEIGFEKDSFHYQRILEKENQAQLEQICQDYLKRKVKVVISPIGQEGRLKREGVAPLEQENPSVKETEEKDLIQEALRLFDGKIVEQ